jgi:glycosyltransferase involved in cell wall biosynthesis
MITHLIPTLDPLTGGPVAAFNNLEKGLADHGQDNTTLVLDELEFFEILRALLSNNSVILSHSIWNIWTLFASLVTPIRGKRVLIFSHGMLSKEAFGVGSSLKKRIFAQIYLAIFRIMGTRILFATQNEFENSHFPGLGGAIVPNIVNLRIDEISHDDKELLSEIRVAYSSRFSPRKGLHTVVKVFKELGLKRLRLDIVALADDEEYERRVRQECAGVENIVFHDGLVGTQAQKIVAKCQVVVLFSEFEGLPMSLLEALAMGKVVVCTSNCNLPNIREEKAGVIVNNTEELSQALINLTLLDAHAFSVKEKSAQEYIQRNFSANVVIDLLIRNST